MLPSRTSIMVAAGRALGARYENAAMRNPDFLAEKLIGPDELALVQEHPIAKALADTSGASPTYEAAGTAVMMLIRTKFIDEKLQQAIANGVRQVVILGAGFDTRAHRFPDLLQDAKVFEVDSHATQNYKRARAETAIGPPPANLTYVTVDFNRDKLGDVLPRAGWDPHAPTFFTWEGVSMYVAEAGIRETLGAVAKSAPGSILIMDFTTQSAIDFMHKFPQYGPSKYLNEWGEPWVFGLPDGKEREFFTGVGLEPVEFFAVFSPESIKRYLTAPDGTVIGMPPPEARPQVPEELKTAGALMAQSGQSFYTLAELVVPPRK